MKTIHLDLSQIVCGSPGDTESITNGSNGSTPAPQVTNGLWGNGPSGIYGD